MFTLEIFAEVIYIYIYIYIYICVCVFLFNKTISMFYSLFVFCLCYKIIGLSSLNLAGHGLAGRGLTHLWPAGMGRAWA